MTDMIKGLMKGEEKSRGMSWMIPEVSKYTASAMRTLGSIITALEFQKYVCIWLFSVQRMIKKAQIGANLMWNRDACIGIMED